MDAEKRRENVKAWKERNPDRVKAQKARHYMKNSDAYKARQKAAYDALTPEQKRARAREARERRHRLKVQANGQQ